MAAATHGAAGDLLIQLSQSGSSLTGLNLYMSAAGEPAEATSPAMLVLIGHGGADQSTPIERTGRRPAELL
jgi:hypothetical protein